MASILIIDDDQAFSGAVGQQLAASGHAATVQHTGKQGLEALGSGEYHLLILDIMLPDISGFEVCRRIRRDPSLFTMPIIMISSMNSDEEILHGLAQGADDYIPKPCDPQVLMQRTNSLLRITSEDNTTDELTQLPSGAHTKREIQRRMATTEPFALAYFELLSLREFSYRSGADARCKAIRHLGRALQKVGGSIFGDEPFVGHMGGGHFVCLTEPTEAARFGRTLRAAWEKHLEGFYQSVGDASFAEDAKNGTQLDVLCCITGRDSHSSIATPQAIFETISQIRQRALAARRPGVYLDQREFHAG